MVALTDAEQSMIFRAAAPLAADRREAFIAAVRGALAGQSAPVGEGTVNRAIRAQQREFFDPPAGSDGYTHRPRHLGARG